MTGRDPQQMEDRVIQAALALAVFASVIGNIVSLPIQWQVPLIFLALFGIFKAVLPTRQLPSQLEENRQALAALHEKIGKLIDGSAAVIRLDYYPTNTEFYESVRRRVSEATERVSVTYIRRIPPTAFATPEAGKYFDYVLQWARDHPNRSVRRIVCVPDDRMRVWAVQHCKETGHLTNYEVRVVEWTVKVDALNLAIMDDKAVFLAFSGETEQEMRGLSLRNRDAVNYFNVYYNQMWHAATPLHEYLGVRRHELAEIP